MAKTVAVLTPYSDSPAIELGNHRWRKQLLPVGNFDYKGRRLSFTKDYFVELAKSFKDAAFDSVPFQLADADNKHTNDPERTRGSIADVEVADDGLYLIVETTDEGDKVIRQNPKLGVSARIYENYKRSDGKRWTAALQHVLGTLDPHIPGMKPWQEVAAFSNAGSARVLDLTSATLSEGEEHVPLDKAALKELLTKVRDGASELSDEDIDELLDATDPDDTDDEDVDSEELSDEELAALLADAENELETETVSASNQNGDGILDLAGNAAFQQQSIELARVTAALNGQQFENEKSRWAHSGVPPKLVELARPLLEGEGHVVELAGGDQIDAGAVVRQVFSELGKQIKILDLGGLIGSGAVPDDEEEEAAKREAEDRAAFVKAERARSGL